MTTETRNEAAGRLIEAMISFRYTGNWPESLRASELLQQALVAERRATVERIRARLLSELPAPMTPGDEILWSTVVAILDEAVR